MTTTDAVPDAATRWPGTPGFWSALAGPTRQDLPRVRVALLAARELGELERARAEIMAARRAWRAWLAVTQRRWQGETRRAGRARHYDSVEIRERYVRCPR